MILIDSSIWINLLSIKPSFKLTEDILLNAATCPPITQEVFQGFKYEVKLSLFRVQFLALPQLSDPVPLNIYLKAAELFSFGRRKGYTIRSSVDCLIAAIALSNKVKVWHNDRDFKNIAKFTDLEEFT